MKIIQKLSDLDGTLPPAVEALVRERLEMLAEFDEELARFIIPEPGDDMAAVENELGASLSARGWEFITDHGKFWEAPFILSDDGYGLVLIVVDAPDIDPALIALCRANAESADHQPI
jgi:hypothetical protein